MAQTKNIVWVGTEKIGKAYLVLGLPGGGKGCMIVNIFSSTHEGAGTDTESAVHFRVRVPCICYAHSQQQKYKVDF